MTTSKTSIEFSAIFEPSLSQIMKGLSLEYTRIIPYVVNMDLSSNKLVGEIPEELTSLRALIGLNLSNNHLTGRIPNSIGDMHLLISLDLSGNNLSGIIPQSISRLMLLSHLNLSHNNLSGRIPTGSQIQTLVDPSIYAGNIMLCGSPLPKRCNRDMVTDPSTKKVEDDDEVEDRQIWIYSTTSGFITGFMGILGILALNRRLSLFIFNIVQHCIGEKIETQKQIIVLHQTKH